MRNEFDFFLFWTSSFAESKRILLKIIFWLLNNINREWHMRNWGFICTKIYLNRKCRFRLTLWVVVVHKNFNFVNRCKIYSKLHWGWVGQGVGYPVVHILVTEVGSANNSRISVNPITIKSKNLYKTPYKVLRTRRTSIHKLRIYRIKGKDVCQGEAFLAISVIKNNHNIH